MQNSFASRAYASFALAEKGDQQPRSLAQAFLKPVKPYDDQDMLDEAIKALVLRRDRFDKVYGACADSHYVMNVQTPEGNLSELTSFVAG
jgi:CRISPR system Cascade subunit CasC